MASYQFDHLRFEGVVVASGPLEYFIVYQSDPSPSFRGSGYLDSEMLVQQVSPVFHLLYQLEKLVLLEGVPRFSFLWQYL